MVSTYRAYPLPSASQPLTTVGPFLFFTQVISERLIHKICLTSNQVLPVGQAWVSGYSDIAVSPWLPVFHVQEEKNDCALT